MRIGSGSNFLSIGMLAKVEWIRYGLWENSNVSGNRWTAGLFGVASIGSR